MSYSVNASRLTNRQDSLQPATPSAPVSMSFVSNQNSIVEQSGAINSYTASAAPLASDSYQLSTEVAASAPPSGSYSVSGSALPAYSLAESAALPIHTPFKAAATPYPLSSMSRLSNRTPVVPSVAGRVALDLLELIRSNDSTLTATQKTQLLSAIESEMLSSSEPIASAESEIIEVNGSRGIWMNKSEVANWQGEIPITQYLINNDANPEIITKRSQQVLEYVQEMAIRYLRPPTPPAPGEIMITQEANKLTPPAPPLVMRQLPARPITPEPLVIREAPPQPPPAIGRKIITISGKRIPPPPRKVVIERFAQLPAKPQAVLIERWLPYAEVKRRVIFQAAPPDPIVVKPRNTIVQWEAPQINVRKEYKYLGTVRANPIDYVRLYHGSLKTANLLPDFVLNLKHPEGVVLAAEHQPRANHELEGDLHALNLIDLDKEGLSAYRQHSNFISQYQITSAPLVSSLSRPLSQLAATPAAASFSASASASVSASASAPAQSGAFTLETPALSQIASYSASYPVQSGSYSTSYPVQSGSYTASASANASTSASALAASLSLSTQA